MNNIFVARQPIFDRDAQIVGYELLYRTSREQNWASGADARTMSSDVIIHSVLNMGLERITGGLLAFVNITSDMLVSDLFELLDPSQVVIELLQTAVYDQYTIRACERLAAAGYTLALDHFATTEVDEAISRLAHIVKVDFVTHTPEAVAVLARSLEGSGVKLLAEKIESAEAYELARSLGFEMFQGYYFAYPEILAERDIPLEGLGIIKILGLLRDSSTSDEQIEDALATSPGLSFLLLRIVDPSARGSMGIQSMRHAIQLLGRDKLQRWLSLLFVSSLAPRNDLDTERAIRAIARARLCEMIGRASGQSAASGQLFLVGMVSAFESLLAIPLTEILSRIDLAPAVRAALLDSHGPYANVLQLVQCYERAEWEHVPALVTATGVSVREVTDLYLESLTWARDRLRDQDTETGERELEGLNGLALKG
ncbi:MAG TPA: EAL domain-containing protein [Gemmatimonadaceae bacterium]|nr:EAL domain-containing protein [Gemmatimonadaceae bacterium]